jgi:FixJ family two-component response regulator
MQLSKGVASFVIFLVDDDEGVLRALSRLLRAAGYETRAYASPADFLANYNRAVPGCMIIDLCMPGIDGWALQQEMAEKEPGRPIIFLTGKGDIAAGVRAMKAGAVDFLTKPVDHKQLLDAVVRAQRNDEEARRGRRNQEAFDQLLARLTPREREVLDHVLTGRMNKQIAATLGTVEKTIKVHRGRVMAKLEVRSVVELVRLCERAGMSVSSRPR